SVGKGPAKTSRTRAAQENHPPPPCKAQTARPKERRPKKRSLTSTPKPKIRSSKKADTPAFKKEGQRFKTNNIYLTPSVIFFRRRPRESLSSASPYAATMNALR
ncbi:hypothetical protein, partial [Alcaligenes aquatilis]|uniref:hypothetical protein n=1 Tax=Alcaligenes aquatilis TaxID=323284 RepID=UPI003F927ADF